MKDVDIYENAGGRIKGLRKKYNLSREEMARLVGITSKFIYEIETGRKGFSAGVLYRIATSFGVDCDYIMRKGNEQQQDRKN